MILNVEEGDRTVVSGGLAEAGLEMMRHSSSLMLENKSRAWLYNEVGLAFTMLSEILLKGDQLSWERALTALAINSSEDAKLSVKEEEGMAQWV